jgi:organic hydroperoxide reductase OsmC/OhrA
MTNKNVESTPQLTRKGTRRNAGADTPSGPDSKRSPIPAERENAGKNPSDIMPGAHPGNRP